MEDLIAAVKTYAVQNYNSDGWDIVVECYDRDELAEIIGDASTVNQAIARVGNHVGVIAEYRADIQGA